MCYHSLGECLGGVTILLEAYALGEECVEACGVCLVVEALDCGDELVELLSVDSECLLLATTVDDVRYLTLATSCLSELLTELRTCSTVNLN